MYDAQPRDRLQVSIESSDRREHGLQTVEVDSGFAAARLAVDAAHAERFNGVKVAIVQGDAHLVGLVAGEIAGDAELQHTVIAHKVFCAGHGDEPVTAKLLQDCLCYRCAHLISPV